MKKNATHLFKSLLLTAAAFVSLSGRVFAQCADSTAPIYSHSCSNEYFESIAVSGAGVTSTVYITGVGYCSGTYKNYYAMQGTTAPAGSTVTFTITKAAEYASFLSAYVDWNNDGVYESSELAGTMLSLSPTTGDTSYSFTVPATGAVTGTNLHMRLMLSEEATGAPCTASYGQTYDFFLIIGSGCTMPVVTTHPRFTNDTVSNCPGGTGITISASGAGMGGTFTWAPAAGLTADTGSTVTANPATTTVYTITAASTGTCTATLQDTVTVITTGMPADSILYTGSGAFCLGDTLTLMGTTGAGYTYQWYEDGIAQNRAHYPNYQVVTGGIYTLVIDAYGCIDTSAALVLTTNPPPTPTITYNGTTFYTGSGYVSYQWYLNGAVVTGATTDSLVATGNGEYNVQVTDTNGCTAMAGIYPLAVANVANLSGIFVYPNPADAEIYIVSPVSVTATITSIDGAVIMRRENTHSIDISRMAAGIYFVGLCDESGHQLSVQKIIKN